MFVLFFHVPVKKRTVGILKNRDFFPIITPVHRKDDQDDVLCVHMYRKRNGKRLFTITQRKYTYLPTHRGAKKAKGVAVFAFFLFFLLAIVYHRPLYRRAPSCSCSPHGNVINRYIVVVLTGGGGDG